MARGGKPLSPGVRACAGIFPSGFHNGIHGAWIYAIGLPSGLTKIGMTRHPRVRIASHLRSNGSLEWAHLFRKFDNGDRARDAEGAAIFQAALISTRIRNTEVFSGLSREQAISVVRAGIALVEAW